MKKNIFYTYIYTNPSKPGKFKYPGLKMTFDFRPFYVGKGKLGRVWRHITEARNHQDKNRYKCNTIRKILEDYTELELRAHVIFPHQNISDAKSKKLEIEMIALIGRNDQHDKKKGPLTNMTDGGEGPTGYKHTQESKDKWQETIKRRGTITCGVKCHTARKFLITEPNGKEHIFHGAYISWVREQNLSERLLAEWMDRGPITHVGWKKNKHMLGWSVQHID
jgi:hypothetical protein